MVFVFSDVHVTMSPNDTSAVEGQNTSLSCEFCSNLQNVTVNWMHGSQTVSSKHDRFVIETNHNKSTLSILNLQASDVGEYRCNASSREMGVSGLSTPGHVSLQCKCSTLCARII